MVRYECQRKTGRVTQRFGNLRDKSDEHGPEIFLEMYR